MSDVTQMRKPDRTESRLLRSLMGRLERYMARAGLIAFAVEPAAEPAAAPAAAAAVEPAAAPAADPAPAATTLLGGEPAAAPAADPAKPAEGNPDPNAKPADDGKPKDGEKPAGAPEKYEDFKLPEGMQPDTALMGEFGDLARELNLPQETAQKLVDMAGKMQQGNVEHLQAQLTAQGEQWAADAKADKEFGGDKFAENIAVANRALEQFGTPDLKALLVQSKLGNHPEVLRAFYRVGQAISQDGFVPGRAGGGKPNDARSMYANSNMNP